MKITKKIMSALLAFSMTLTLGAFSASATTNDTMDSSEQEMFEFHRMCDETTGNILEKYDTLLNGANDVDYVSLATSLSMDKSDRIAAMNFIIQIYSDVDDTERVYLKSYIKSYAPYTEEGNLHYFCNELSTTFPSAQVTYSRTNAVEYALDYYNSTNPAYPDLRSMGGDCANFVSQCLHAGGKDMTDEWYIEKKNNTYPAPENVTQLNNSWKLADPSPWISAKEFNNYWSDYATTYEYKVTDYKKDHETIYKKSILKGDAVQLLKPVLWWYEGMHTMIIVGYDASGSDFIYAAHSNDTKDSSILSNICNASNGIYDKYHLKFFHVS